MFNEFVCKCTSLIFFLSLSKLVITDIILQKVKQRYNNTRSLKPRTNLNDMSQEVKLRPPHRLSLDDIGLEQMYETNGSMVAEHFNPLPGKFVK